MHLIPFAGCFDASRKSQHSLVFVGLPDDSQSSYRRGCAEGPQHIRVAYDGNCYNSATETGVDLAGSVTDLGDLPAKATWKETAETYRTLARSLFEAGRLPFCAGGDHAVTVPIVAALEVLRTPVHVVQLDAHPDLYPAYEGNRDSHACTGARVLEMPHVAALTQIGIRTLTRVQEEQIRRHSARVHLVSASELTGALPDLEGLPPDGPVYLSIDLDCFEPAFAPGVSHPVPGGLTPRQVIDFLHRLRGRLVGMDVVELNPSRDVGERTAVLAGRLLHEGMGVAMGQNGQADGS